MNDTKSRRFVEDFKTGNTGNELVKLCMDQGWVLEEGSFYYSDKIFADTLLFPVCYLDVYFRSVDDYIINFGSIRSSREEILVPFPKRLCNKYYIKNIEIPPRLFIEAVEAKGVNPHLDYDGHLCVGTLNDQPIYNLWRFVDMMKIVEANGGCNQIDAIDIWTEKLGMGVVRSLIRGNSRKLTKDVAYMRDQLLNILENGDSGVFGVR